jgi:hypothetical protein
MDSKIVMFAVLSLAAVFAMVGSIDYVAAQTSDAMPDGGESKDGEYEGKSCPSKEKKTSSLISSLEI